jgi:hypothetical protein
LSNQGFKYIALIKYCATDKVHRDCEAAYKDYDLANFSPDKSNR